MIISTRLLVIALFPIFHKLFQISFEVKLGSDHFQHIFMYFILANSVVYYPFNLFMTLKKQQKASPTVRIPLKMI